MLGFQSGQDMLLNERIYYHETMEALSLLVGFVSVVMIANCFNFACCFCAHVAVAVALCLDCK